MLWRSSRAASLPHQQPASLTSGCFPHYVQAVAMPSGSNGILCDVSNPLQATLFGWDGRTLAFDGQYLSPTGAFAVNQTMLDFPPGKRA